MSRRRWAWTFGSIPVVGLDSLAASFSHRTSPERVWVPNADVYACEDSLQVVLELPGVDAENVEVRFDSSACVLSVRGVREARQNDSLTCQQLELYYGLFEREIALPQVVVDVSRIRARYDDGLLCIELPIWHRGNSDHTIRVESN